MTPEDRLRAAIRAHTEATEPDTRAWDEIQRRITMSRNRRARYLVVPAAAAAVAAVLIGASLLGDDDEAPTAVETSASSTTEAPATTTTTTVVERTWLFPADDTRYDTPEKLANAFARDFLGMRNPVVKSFRQNEPHAGEIDIHPNPRATLRTVLSVMENDQGWVVNAANSPTLQVDVPADDSVVSSPLKLSGRSVAFEGTVQMKMLENGAPLFGEGHLGEGFFTGNGDTMGPFEARLEFRRSSTPTGLLVLFTLSAEDGSVMNATVRRVRFR